MSFLRLTRYKYITRHTIDIYLKKPYKYILWFFLQISKISKYLILIQHMRMTKTRKTIVFNLQNKAYYISKYVSLKKKI